ncbi:hypothetical protein LX36DRAFT_693377 [Colletotrichum falcatum]|nr:hypothetical protein LX36DRAFT_693377 [Colletotrichum falcatum]
MDQHLVRYPTVIITDYDKQMKAALNKQFPDVQQQLCIHHINSNVMLKAKQKWLKDHSYSSDSSGSDDEGYQPPTQATATLSDEDEAYINTSVDEPPPHTYRGVLMMWKLVVFAETEHAFEKAWTKLCKEFNDQRPILQYLHTTYLPLRAQWARCFIRKYQNFGIRVTSGTESSNNNIKSYLLNGLSHLYRLVDVMQEMIRDQELRFRQACAEDKVLTGQKYIGTRFEYLGELRTMLSSKCLTKAMPSGKRPFPAPLGECGLDCTVSIELGIPCCHKIYSKILDSATFSKWEVHPRWRLRETSSSDPYRRILDPKIAVSLRGRPKNTVQPVPSQLALPKESQSASQAHTAHSSQGTGGKKRGRPPGSRNNQISQSQISSSSQRQTRSQSSALGRGRTTGNRASGRPTQPSIRRGRSQWEMVCSDDESLQPRRPLIGRIF